MKILLTGATGFLGGEIARQLAQKGHELRLTTRPTSKLEGLANVPHERVVADLGDEAALLSAMQGVDAVIHTAGNVGNRLADRDALYRVNRDGTKHLMEAAQRAGIKRVVHTSSIVAVGASDKPELLNESSPWTVGGTGYHYVDSKRQAEEVALSYNGKNGMTVISVNPGMIMGPGDVYFTSTRVVLEYLKGRSRFIIPGGLSYCDVRQVAAAHINALKQGTPGQRYVVAGLNYTLEQTMQGLYELTRAYSLIRVPRGLLLGVGRVAEVVAHLAPHSAVADLNRPFLEYSMKYAFFDSRRAQKDLDYQPGNFEQVLRDTINDFIVRGVVKGIRLNEDAAPSLRQMSI